jgi:hypothetical protein
MEISVFLAQRVGPQFGLNEETAKAAKPGKMAQLMDKRSGLPPEEERTALAEREKKFRAAGPNVTLAVFPPRIGGRVADVDSAAELVKAINDAALCQAAPAKEAIELKSSLSDPNELKALWDLAREFREYVRKNPPQTDYALVADYVFTPNHWEQGFVHFVVCDQKGEWVLVDMQNSHHADYQNIKPTSKEDCDRLLVTRLQQRLQ